MLENADRPGIFLIDLPVIKLFLEHGTAFAVQFKKLPSKLKTTDQE